MTTAEKTKKAAPAADKKIELSDAVTSLSKVIAKSLKVEKDGTVAVSGNFVEENLPEDLTMATIKKVEKYRGEIMAGAVTALGHVGLPALKKDKDLKEASVEFKFGNDAIGLTLHREKEFNDGQGGRMKKYGYVAASYTAKGTANSGELKKARTLIGDEAGELFGK